MAFKSVRGFEPGSLMWLLDKKASTVPAKTAEAEAEIKDDESMDTPRDDAGDTASGEALSSDLNCRKSATQSLLIHAPREDAGDTVSGEEGGPIKRPWNPDGEPAPLWHLPFDPDLHEEPTTSAKSEPLKCSGPPRRPRKLRGSIAEKLGKSAPQPKPPPLKIDALKGSRMKAIRMGQGPVAVWERAIDERRHAVYYWDHISGKASWQPPPMHEGWWERLYDERSRCDFFWNSASQLTLWHLPLSAETMPRMPVMTPSVFSAESPFALPSCPAFPTVPAPKSMPSAHESPVKQETAVAGFERSGLLSTGCEFSDTGGVKIETLDIDVKSELLAVDGTSKDPEAAMKEEKEEDCEMVDQSPENGQPSKKECGDEQEQHDASLNPEVS